MREIICRGKDLDNKWRIGYLGVFKGKVQIFVPFTTEEEKENEGHFLSAIGGLWYNIKPETVGQFTGLTDKNGKKIFEGDILKGYIYPFYNKDKDEFNYFAEIVYFENSPAFGYVTHKIPTSKVNGISAGDTDYLEDFYPPCWEVIGNIHDDPELMGGDAK